MGKKNETTAAGAGTGGYVTPLEKEALDEVMRLYEDVQLGHVIVYIRALDESKSKALSEAARGHDYGTIADTIRESVVRQVVKQKIREVVRKKKGGGGFTLYAPNKGKKHTAKPLATFPTKLAAKRAELARFPPKDPKKLQRLRKEVERLMKDPKKRAEAERRAMTQKGMDSPEAKTAHDVREPVPAQESVQRMKKLVEMAFIAKITADEVKSIVLGEGLFRNEEAKKNPWDEFVETVAGKYKDDRFDKLNSGIEKAGAAILGQVVKKISRAIGKPAKVVSDELKTKKDERTGKVVAYFVPFSIVVDSKKIGPIFVYRNKNDAKPHVELGDSAVAAIEGMDREFQQAVTTAFNTATQDLEGYDVFEKAVGRRDKYLSRIETEVDEAISKLVERSPLSIEAMRKHVARRHRELSKRK